MKLMVKPRGVSTLPASFSLLRCGRAKNVCGFCYQPRPVHSPKVRRTGRKEEVWGEGNNYRQETNWGKDDGYDCKDVYGLIEEHTLASFS